MPLRQIILTIGIYLSFVRGTNINLFYPSDAHQLNTIDYTLQTAFNYILITLVFAYFFISNNYRFLRDALTSPKILPVIIICVVSVGLSVEVVQSIKFMSTVFAVSMFSAIYAYERGSERLIHTLANFVIVMCFINLAYVLAMPQYGIMTAEHAGSWRGLFNHKNVAGPFFAIGFFCILSRLQRHAYQRTLIPCIALIICLIFVVLSKSSTGLVGFFGMTIFYTGLLVIFRTDQPLKRIALVLGLISVAALLLIFGGELFMTLFFEATGKDATFTGRTNIWRALFELSKERPIIGYGLGMAQNPDFMERIHGMINFGAASSHNSFLDLIINLGYPGAVLVVCLLMIQLVKLLTRDYRYSDDLLIGTLATSMMLTMLLVGFTTADVLIGRSAFWLLMFITLIISGNPGGKRSVSAPKELVKDFKGHQRPLPALD